MQTVQPALTFMEPNFNPWIYRLVRLGLPWWLRYTQGIPEITLNRGEILATQLSQFQQGQIRLLLAYRHPTTADPPCLIHTLSNLVPKIAKAAQIPLKQPVHAHFMYDRGIPLWAGPGAAWLLPRLGATSILRGRLDRQGLKSARTLLLDGPFPLAAAPEGGANGHSDILNPLEPGLAQLSFWCQEDLHKANRPEHVVILPIHTSYHYLGDPEPAIRALLTRLEQDCGLTPAPTQSISQRLAHLGEHLLPQMERFYSQFFPKPITQALKTTAPPPEQDLPDRLSRLLDIALQVAEFNLNLQPQGSLIERRHRIEQAAWDRIYCLDETHDSQSPIERGLANRIAQEAHLHLWHMRLVETFIAMTHPPHPPAPTPTWAAESTLRFWSVITRLKGHDPLRLPQPHLGSRRASFTIGDPIAVTPRWSAYQTNRRQAIQTLTDDLQTALMQLMHPPQSIQPIETEKQT